LNKRLNVLLIRPKSNYSDVVAGIPIGITLLAAVAEKRGHNVRILDLGLEKNADGCISTALHSSEYDIAGLSCMSFEFLAGIETAELIRRISPCTHIIFGGHHPTNLPEQVMQVHSIDSVCIGEGEDTWTEFLERVSSRGELHGVKGLWFRNGEEIVRNAPRCGYVDVDSVPMPAYHLLDVERYFDIDFVRFPTANRRAIQIFTSRGCPYQCIYCHKLFGNKFRGRRPDLVLEEIKYLNSTFGIREFMIEDDIFNMNLGRAKQICDLIVASGLKIGLQFGNGVRLDRFDEELMRKLAAAGTHHMAIAIESASNRIQGLIGKKLNLDRTGQVLAWARKYGIETLGFFMLGFPSETVDEIHQTIRFACNSHFDEALFSIATPYAGTELSRLILTGDLYEEGHDSRNEWEGVVRIKSDEWDYNRLRRLQRKAYFVFFLTRFRFVKILFKMKNPKMFRRYWAAFARNFVPFFEKGKSRIN
jgi:anaerobic magnesium-protoporphyrin IX monomethyl ester cyclase